MENGLSLFLPNFPRETAKDSQRRRRWNPCESQSCYSSRIAVRMHAQAWAAERSWYRWHSHEALRTHPTSRSARLPSETLGWFPFHLLESRHRTPGTRLPPRGDPRPVGQENLPHFGNPGTLNRRDVLTNHSSSSMNLSWPCFFASRIASTISFTFAMSLLRNASSMSARVAMRLPIILR